MQIQKQPPGREQQTMIKNIFAFVQLSLMAALLIAPLFYCLFLVDGGAWIISVAVASLGTSIGIMLGTQSRPLFFRRCGPATAPACAPASASR